MSRTLRMLGAMALATATVPFLGVSPASADESKLAPSTGAYFYAEGIRKPDESPAAPPNLTGDRADGVAPGNLAVAAQAGQEDKVSFLLFDLLELLPGTVVSKAVLTLPLVENSPPDNVTYGAAPEKVRACAAGDQGFNGDDGVSIQDAPERKCAVFSAAAKASADGKSYTVDITKLAQKWVDEANDGVALTAADGAATTPFQVVFAPADKASLALTFTPAVEDTVDPVVDVPDTTTTTPETPDVGTGFSGEVIPPPSDGGFGAVSSPTLPEAPAPAPAAGVPPQAAAPAAPAAAVPVASESLQPTTGFWLAGLVLAALFVLLSLIMGDSTVPVAASRPSRLTRALADRQRGTRGSSLSRPSLGRPAAV